MYFIKQSDVHLVSGQMLLVLFFLVPRGLVMSSSCYSDKNRDDSPRVSCVGQNLSAVPDGTDLGTQVLVLSQNQFVSLSWASYDKFTLLHELDLSQNHVRVIDPSGERTGRGWGTFD